uniref:G-protein coupled receptors family 1 profile domain-containing protein n=1 Tax=Latimeria chalumnae TaxID=7897 RepID=H3B7V0_LATCH
NQCAMANVSEQAKKFLSGKFMTVFMPSFFTLIFLLSTLMNLLALIMLLRMKKTPTIIFMANLATADLFFALLLPFKIAYHFNGNNWVFGDVMCRILGISFYGNMYCAILLITAMSVDRYLGIVHALLRFWRTKRYATVVCSVIWAVTICLIVPYNAESQTACIIDLNITTCMDVNIDNELKVDNTVFSSFLVFVLFFLPFLVILFCYYRIIKHLTDPNDIKKAVFVVLLFTACFTPMHVLVLLRLFFSQYLSPSTMYFLILICLCLSSMNCCLDPLLYYFSSKPFRNRVSNYFHHGTIK